MKVIKMGEEARASKKVGVDFVVNLDKKTLGGKGRIISIDSPNGLHPTVDGITVIANTSLPDPTENMGVKVVQEAAIEQDLKCADGTTSVSGPSGFINQTLGSDGIWVARETTDDWAISVIGARALIRFPIMAKGKYVGMQRRLDDI